MTSTTLRDLADRYWEARLVASPLFATFIGDHRYDDRVDDISAEYLIDVVVRTRLRQILQAPCTVLIDVEQVGKRDVYSHTAPKGVPARLVGWVGNINDAVAERVAGYINELIDSPRVVDIRRIDVAALLERAWAAGLVVASQP